MKIMLHRILAFVLTIAMAPAFAQAPAGEYSLDIAGQPLVAALKEFSQQTGLQVGYLPASAVEEGMIIGPLKGHYTAEAALGELLARSGLSFRRVNGKTIAVVRPEEGKAGRETAGGGVGETGNGDVASGLRYAQGAEGPESDVSTEVKNDGGDSGGGVDRLEEIVVTGSHIRGSKASASPIQVYTRKDIEQTGAGTIARFLETRSQNFSDISEISKTAINGGRAGNVNNVDGSSGANLRGLGTESTLVLINGRRIAAGGVDGGLTDISIIPMTAIDRVEIVTDGASAIYGSDAVGGVVNLIMRKDFSGSETRARFGAVTKGGYSQATLGETLGHTWDGGSALLSYEYFDQDDLSAADRSFSEAAPQPFDLLPDVTRHGVFLSMQQEVRPGVGLFLNGTYASRSTTNDYSLDETSPQRDVGKVDAYTGAIGVNVLLGRRTDLEVSASYGASTTHRKNYFDGSQLQVNKDSKPTVASADAKLNGALWRIPAGDIMYALGVQYRRETLELTNFLNLAANLDIDRDVLAQFVEFRVPIIGPRAGADSSENQLELSLADRNEKYSDFGSTNNPKVGFYWRTGVGMVVRGTYGTSFRAPALTNLNSTPTLVLPYPLPELAGQGTMSCEPFNSTTTCTNALFVQGGNGNLQPEKAKTWTVGLDLEPRTIPGLKANLSYYSIRYTDRIADPTSFVPLLTFLQNEAILGPAIVQRNPTPERVQQLIASAGGNYQNFFGIDTSTISAVADTRLQNVATVKTRGVDFDVSYKAATSIGSLEAGLEGTKILTFTNALTRSTSSVDIIDTAYNPVSLRLRARAVWVRGNGALSIFINHVGSYQDSLSEPAERVDDWNTADATFNYEFDSQSGWSSNLSLTLGVTNITDSDPPYLQNTGDYAINFDAANANPLGRSISFQMSKRL